jgi:hypothetical protein
MRVSRRVTVRISRLDFEYKIEDLSRSISNTVIPLLQMARFDMHRLVCRVRSGILMAVAMKITLLLSLLPLFRQK